MSDSEAPVLVSKEGAVGIATLNRPTKFNCISRELAQGLLDAVRTLETDKSVRVMLLKANGKHFCTGADLDQVKAARATRDGLKDWLGGGHEALYAMEASRLPVIGVVHGLALAGGLELAMACDVVFAGRSAKLGDQHAQYGLIPGWGGTQRLPRLVGLRRALDLMYSGRWLSSEEAMDWGLVNAVHEDGELQDKATAYASQLAKRNPEGIAAMKSLSRQGFDGTLRAGIAAELDSVADGLRSANVEEGLAAFAERREPAFK
ncbi:MAG: enoyl-CoA hydratase/isomerase family protein [Reyranellaceae bacterium]